MRIGPVTSSPTPWNMKVEFGVAYRFSPAKKITLPMESTLAYIVNSEFNRHCA